MSLQKAGRSLSSPALPKFKPPRTGLTLDFYAAPDGGRLTTYEAEHSLAECVGDQAKKRVYLNQGALPKAVLSKEAVLCGSAKALGNDPSASVLSDPRVSRLMREIQHSEGRRQKVLDPEAIEAIRSQQKMDHVSGMFTEPRYPDADKGTSHATHRDFTMDRDTEKVHRQHFNKKSFYTDYTDALVKNKHLGGKGPAVK